MTGPRRLPRDDVAGAGDGQGSDPLSQTGMKSLLKALHGVSQSGIVGIS
jgi:hypothetical protein